MYDDDAISVAPRNRAAGEDFIETLERDAQRGSARRERPVHVGRQLTRAKPLDSVAKRLVIIAGSDVPTTTMVALMSAGKERVASYIAADMRMLNGRPFWRVSEGEPVQLAQFGLSFELSGRTGGGVYFRCLPLQRNGSTKQIKTKRGLVGWRGFATEWVRLHPAAEQEVVP